MNTIRYYQIILNTLERDLKTGRKNSTTKEREDATSKTVGNADMWFRGEMDHKCYRQEEVIVAEKGEKERSTHRRMFPQSHWLGKRKGLNF